MNTSGITSADQLQSTIDVIAQKQQETPGLFQHLITTVNADQQNMDTAIYQFMTGENDNIQQVVAEMVKSEMSFNFFMEVRNQAIESYNELMRMQV